MIRRLIILLLIVGCDNSTESNNDIYSLIGEWETVKYSISNTDTTYVCELPCEIAISQILLLRSDSTFTGSFVNGTDSLPIISNGIWDANSEEITFIYLPRENTSTCDYSLDSQLLVIQYDYDNGNTEIAELKRLTNPL